MLACAVEYDMNKPSVFKNTALITTLSCLERGLGFFYRIVLARLLGAEGVGVYQIALSHCMLFQTAAGGGIPVTLSRTVSSLNADGKTRQRGSALLAALTLGACISLPITLILFPLAGAIPLFSADAPVLKILLLSLCATSAYVAIKGYFWGNKQFLAPALFEMAEQILTVLLGVALLSGARGFSAVEGASLAAWAHTLACLGAFLLSLLVLLCNKPQFSSPTPFLSPLLKSAAPITAVRTGSTLINAAVAVLLPATLVRTGMSESAALQAFGVVTGMVIPLLGMPLTIIGSLAIVLVPELAEDFQKRNLRRVAKNVERGVFFAVAVACLIIPFFLAVGKPLGAITYQNSLAGEMLARCAPLLLPLSATAILTSMLNSLGFERQTFVFSLFGSAVLLLSILLLPARLGIYAYPIGLLLQFLLEAVCSLRLLKKHCPPSKRFYQKTGLCVLLTPLLGGFGRFAFVGFSLFLGTKLATFCACICLAIAAFAVYTGCKLIPRAIFQKKSSSNP